MKRYIYLLIGLVISSLSCVLSPAPSFSHLATATPVATPTVMDPTALADEALERGDLEAAGELYRQALDADPSDGRALSGLGLVFYHQARYDEARHLLGQAVDLSPRDTRAWMALGRTALALRCYDSDDEHLLAEAGDAFEHWATLELEEQAPQAYLAWIAYLNGDAAAISRRLAAVEAVSPDDPVAHLVRAMQMCDQGDYAAEVEHGLAAWESLEAWQFPDLESVVCAHLIGYGYGQQERYEEAIEWGLMELQLGPALPYANSNLACWYVYSGNCEEAAFYIEREIELYPDHWHPYFLRSVCAVREGDEATAFSAYREAVLRGCSDDYHWYFDLHGSAGQQGISVELTGVDIYGRMAEVHMEIDNSSGRQVWFHNSLVEWSDGSRVSYVGIDKMDLAAGRSTWVITVHNVMLSPGGWLRVTPHFQLLGFDYEWVEIPVEVEIPAFASDEAVFPDEGN